MKKAIVFALAATAFAAFAEEYIEIAHSVLIAILKVTVTHGQLIKIAEHGQIEFIVDNHLQSPRYRFVSIILHFAKIGKGFH